MTRAKKERKKTTDRQRKRKKVSGADTQPVGELRELLECLERGGEKGQMETHSARCQIHSHSVCPNIHTHSHLFHLPASPTYSSLCQCCTHHPSIHPFIFYPSIHPSLYHLFCSSLSHTFQAQQHICEHAFSTSIHAAPCFIIHLHRPCTCV